MSAPAFSALDVSPLVTACLVASVADPALGGVVLVDATGAGAEILASFLAAARVAAVRVPVGADRTALIGGVDARASLREGRLVGTAGLLASGDVIAIDDLTRWSPERRALLRRAVGAPGRGVRLYAAWGDTDPPPMAFLDPVAFVIPAEPGPAEVSRRALALARRLAAGRSHADADGGMPSIIDEVRERLGGVDCGEAAGILARDACALGVEGDRAVVHAVRAARAHAAMRRAAVVEERDLEFARLTVFGSRRGAAARQPPPPRGAGEGERPSGEARRDAATDQDAGAAAAPPEAAPPEAAPEVPAVPAARPHRRGRRRHGGGEARLAAWDRGAPERVMARRPGARRVALAATLRRAALRGGGVPLRVHPEDLRFRRFRRRAGRLFVIAVDASGSMARHRIREAKGVVIELLGEAYRRRDRVAVIVARGTGAEILVPPTASVARARRLMAHVPVGGGTPLASALDEIAAVADRERRRGGRDPVVVLLTDGRANVAAGGGEIGADLEAAAGRFREHDLPCVVVDTTGPFSGRDDARRLAALLAADFHAMPAGRPAGSLARRWID